MAGDPISFASISLVEIYYLVERRRVQAFVPDRLIEALQAPGTALVLIPLDLDIARAIEGIPRDIGSDMPDRIIAVTALRLNVPLVTRDERIRSLSIPTIW